MVFLTDWDWGHYFCRQQCCSSVESWGYYNMEPHIHHCGSNAGMTPKITLNITGLVEKGSIHLSKKKKFYLNKI